MDLIGTIKLNWHNDKEQFTNESEVEFENNMLNYVSEKDRKDKNDNLIKIIKRMRYC